MRASQRVRRRLRTAISFLRNPEFRRRTLDDQRLFKQFKQRFGNALSPGAITPQGSSKTVLIFSRLFPPLEVQIALLKGFELAGFSPTVLTMSGRTVHQRRFRWAGIEPVLEWSDLVDGLDCSGEAAATVDGCTRVEDLLAFEYAGSRCGRIAAATTLRRLRAGSLDLQSTHVRHVLVHQLALSMTAAAAARNILQRVRPALILFHDIEYTPGAELFDRGIVDGAEAVTYREGPKRNTLILKRYSSQNRDHNPVSLSEESWAFMKRMTWSAAHRAALVQELQNNYASGDDVYSAHARLMSSSAVRQRLGLPDTKKTAFIFPHIPWDASLRWGQDLFRNYEEWLIETVRVACANDRVHWVIKIHPANVIKQGEQEPAEVVAVRRAFSSLPSHVSLIPADSDISTLPLFALMDYCVTVRGTTGIEAASFGIPVITAGTGRYEGKGFTIDSSSREQYLDRIANIQEIPRLSPTERELAERYAYGLLLLRPFPLDVVSLAPWGENCFPDAQINVTTHDDWYTASDLQSFAQWINDPRNPDFLAAAEARTEI